MVVDNSLLATDPHLSCYISTGCNRLSNCVDWGSNGLICFGACNSIAICESMDDINRIQCTLSKHSGRINSVKWIRGGSTCYQETELISASSDKTVVIWRLENKMIKPISIMTSHTMPVTIVDGLYSSVFQSEGYPDTYVTSASADSTVKIWLRKHTNNEFSCIYTINLSSGLCLSLALSVIPETNSVILAIGTDDSKLHLYSDKNKLQTVVGHEDWIKCLHFTTSGNHLLLASGSQDSTIRLWRISKKIVHDFGPEFKQAEHVFRLNNTDYVVSLESLLMGHEGWVCGLQWNPNSDGKQLVSCSIDRTILLWEVEEDSGVWLETSRLGELGGNTLGFLNVTFSPDSQTLLANSHQGALHMWKLTDRNIWKSVGCFGGHFEGAVDVNWESNKGRYLLSCSLDKTTRLHAPWSKNSKKEICWFEMSRPQIHGHPMSALAPLPDFTLASSSEEKVVRVFTAPDNVLQNLANLSTSFTVSDRKEGGAPLGAAVPSLGLSNKAVFQGEEHGKSDRGNTKNEFSDGFFTPQFLSEPPTEDNLAQNMLWPEVMKLYGHGYEVYTLAATHAGDILATACKAATPLHAKIIIWDTKSWDQINELEGHNLTVSQMEFSPDDTKLLSVSRDRSWCIFSRCGDSRNFSLSLKSNKQFNPHTRIIWCCSWSYEGLYFATGSRDGKVAVWPGESPHIIVARPPASEPLCLSQPVTALAFTKQAVSCLLPLRYFLVVGLETGTIQAYLWEATSWVFVFTVPINIGHHLTVNKLSFRPVHGKAERPDVKDDSIVQLASCSLDFSVRIYTIDINYWVSNIPDL